jgi:N-acyl-D-aspartate/D-glutamate deacylase
VINDALQARLLVAPYNAICSDGRSIGFHPRQHGAFAKSIEEYVIKRQMFALAEAVQKMTSQSAHILGL